MNSTAYTFNKNSICIFSYNSRGFSIDKQEICKTLMLNTEQHYQILCNLENFLPNARSIFKKAMKDNMGGGRPKNGMFIAVPDEIPNRFKDCRFRIV